MADPKRSALGKGLSALIPDAPEPQAGVTELDVDLLRPNEYQPRLRVDDARLEELAQSIRAHGVIQPIVVRRVGRRPTRSSPANAAGARRGRPVSAACRSSCGRSRARAAHDLLEMALIENIQREDLNAIEEGTRLPAARRRVRT